MRSGRLLNAGLTWKKTAAEKFWEKHFTFSAPEESHDDERALLVCVKQCAGAVKLEMRSRLVSLVKRSMQGATDLQLVEQIEEHCMKHLTEHVQKQVKKHLQEE